MYPRCANSLPVILVVLFFSVSGATQKRLPILDMHMHARTASHYGPPPQPMCSNRSGIFTNSFLTAPER